VATLADVLSAQWLKDTTLLGVDLTLDDGTPYPDELYDHSIRQAIAWLEHEIGIAIDPISVVDERHDAYQPNQDGWWPFDLDVRPLMDVGDISAFGIRFGNYEPVTVPLTWLVPVSIETARVHLIPSHDKLGSYQFVSGIPIILGDVLQPHRFVPGYFHFSYTAGLGKGIRSGTGTILDGQSTATIALSPAEADTRYNLRVEWEAGQPSGSRIRITSRGTGSFDVKSFTAAQTAAAPASGQDATFTWYLDRLPADIKAAIGYKAALLPLDVAGDLIAGAGIASKSTSMDGLSQSVNTTSSSTNSGFGARVLQFEREMKALLPAIRARYTGPMIAAV